MFEWFCWQRFKKQFIPWHYIRLMNRWGKAPYWFRCDYCPYFYHKDKKGTKYQR